MKLMFVFLTVAFLQVNANGFSQTISLSKKNADLKSVFHEIRKQCGYDFFYDTDLLKKTSKVNINVQNASVQEVLDLCFINQPLTYSISGNIITVTSKTTSPIPGSSMPEKSEIVSIDIKGRVTDEEGKPVYGATITEKGSKNATATNENGEFILLNVEATATLIISSINFETLELNLGGRTNIQVQLKATIGQLDVVTISTGYQDIPKERATGSFTKIDNATLNKQVGTNILKRLDGVTSGLLFNTGKTNGNPQNNTNISIRGLSTINGPLDPLVVLDGFIYEGNISNINPNDIENITILKDAAATSIWGARAGNGVIVINTKKGRFNQKLNISVNSTIIVSEKPDLSRLPQMSSSDYIDVEQTLFNNGFFDWVPDSYPYYALPQAVEVFLNRRNGSISSADSLQQIDALKAIDSRDQYNKYVYSTPVVQQHSFNINGGSEKTAYLFSVGYDNDLGELKNTFNKLNIRLENTFKPLKNLQLNLGLYFTNSQAKSGISGYGSIRPGDRSIPYLQLADPNGVPLSIPLTYRELYTDTAGAGNLLDWRYYPLDDYKHNKSVNKTQEILANFGIQYKLASFLNFTLKYQYQKQQSDVVKIADLESYEARNLINTFSEIDWSNNVIKYNVPLGGIRSSNNSIIESHSGRGQLNFDHKWKEHGLIAIFGGEIRQVKATSENNTVFGYNTDPLSYSNVDLQNSYPNYITGSQEKISGSSFLSNTVSRFISLYMNFSYTYKDRYIVTASARKDGSNIFGVRTNDKWKPLWSIGTGWVISNEKFYNSSILPFLKLRATYGYSGNVDLRRTALPTIIYTSNSSSTNFPVARIRSISNPELRWEQSGQFNIGLDFALKKQVLSGSIEYYIKKGNDLYGETPFDYSAFGGTNQIVKNVANMKGTGIDLSIQSKIINTNFKWNAYFLLNYNTSKTLKYYSTSSQNVYSLLSGGNYIIPVVGKPLYGIVAYKWGGLDDMGNPQGYVEGKKSVDYDAIANEAFTKGIDSGNLVFKGTGSPKVFGSIINDFSWNKFSLSINIMYSFGYYFRKSSIRYSALVDNGIGHSDYSKRWKKPGDELITNVPSFNYPDINSNRDDFYTNSEINILKGDHIRLHYITLSYSVLRNKQMSIFNDLHLYVNISNLGILWRANKENLDPDYPQIIRPSKTFAIGLKATL